MERRRGVVFVFGGWFGWMSLAPQKRKLCFRTQR